MDSSRDSSEQFLVFLFTQGFLQPPLAAGTHPSGERGREDGQRERERGETTNLELTAVSSHVYG